MTDASFARVRKLVATASIVGVLATGGLGVASATAAAPAPSAVPRATIVAQGAQAGGSITIDRVAPALHSAPTVDAKARLGIEAQKRIPVGPIIDWIKRNASWIIEGLKSALRRGWTAFKNWWNNLAAWIRWGIEFVASGTLWDIFISLRHYFLGW